MSPSQPFTTEEIEAAIEQAIEVLDPADEEAILRVERDGLDIVLRGQTFVVILRDLKKRLANRQDA